MLIKIIHLFKLRLRLENWQRAWAPVLQVLGVVYTFCWMAFLAYGIMFLIGRVV